MKHAVPFATIVEPEPPAGEVQDHFLPGDGILVSASFRSRAPSAPAAAPRAPVEEPAPPPPDLRQAAREAEAALERRRAEAAQEERRRQVEEEFRQEAAKLEREVADTLARVREIEGELDQDEAQARRAATLMTQGVETLRAQRGRAERIQPENWTASRMRDELPAAEARLRTIEREARAESVALRRALPGRLAGGGSGWASEAAHRLRSTVAFLLPLVGAVGLVGVVVVVALQRL